MRDCKHPEQTSVWFDVLGFILFFWSQNAKICIFECIMMIGCCTRDTVYCYHIHLRGSELNARPLLTKILWSFLLASDKTHAKQNSKHF